MEILTYETKNIYLIRNISSRWREDFSHQLWTEIESRNVKIVLQYQRYWEFI